MKRRILIRPMAEADLRKIRQWYEKQRRGLGDEFVACFEIALSSVADDPQARAVLHADVRRAAIGRFPYGIFYRYLNDVVHVVGVFHARRSPTTIRRRR